MRKFIILVLGLSLTAASCSLLGGSGAKGVLKSEDGGDTFLFANVVDPKGEISGLNANSFVMDPTDPDTLYLGSSNGVHKTTDAAKTWKHILAGMRIGDIAVDPSKPDIIYAAGISAENGRIIKSSDGGATWRDIYTEPSKNNPVLSLAISQANSRVVLAGLNNGEVIRSTDEGTTWQIVRDFTNAVIDLEYTENASAYALTQNMGLYTTSDQGSNWIPIAINAQFGNTPGTSSQSNLQSNVYIDVAFDRRLRGVIFVASQQGLLRTVDGGATWNVMTLPVTNETLTVSSVAINPTNSNSIFAVVGSTLLKTSNGGISWETKKLPTQQNVRHILINPDEPNNIYLGIGSR